MTHREEEEDGALGHAGGVRTLGPTAWLKAVVCSDQSEAGTLPGEAVRPVIGSIPDGTGGRRNLTSSCSITEHRQWNISAPPCSSEGNVLLQLLLMLRFWSWVCVVVDVCGSFREVGPEPALHRLLSVARFSLIHLSEPSCCLSAALFLQPTHRLKHRSCWCDSV